MAPGKLESKAGQWGDARGYLQQAADLQTLKNSEKLLLGISHSNLGDHVVALDLLRSIDTGGNTEEKDKIQIL